jgi:small subunit ribosomal protein S5
MQKNELGKSIAMEGTKVKSSKKKVKPLWKEKILERKRVARGAKGGKKLSFRVTVIVTKRVRLKRRKRLELPKHLAKPRRIIFPKLKRRRRVAKIGIATASGKDIRTAKMKAVKKAKKESIAIRRTPSASIPYSVLTKYKAAKVLLKPAFSGYGVIAGTVTKTILEGAGFENVVGKCLGSSNKLNNAKATFEALKLLNSF